MSAREDSLRRALLMCVDFIENSTDEDPERTRKFFAAREAWREALDTTREPPNRRQVPGERCGWWGEGRGQCLKAEGHAGCHTCEEDGWVAALAGSQ